MSNVSVSRVAYYLAFHGGILMVIFGLLGFFTSFRGIFFHWEFDNGGLVTLVCGAIAIYGARSASTLPWAIALIVVGTVGGGFAGFLVLLGGILGLISALSKKV